MTNDVGDRIREIDELGYCRIPKIFQPREMQRARDLVQSWYERTRDSQSDRVPYLDQNQHMVYNLQNKDDYFLRLLFASEEAERILVHFLNDQWFTQIPDGEPNYILRSYLGRSSWSPLPMHIDSFVPYLGSYVCAMQMVIVLEDMCEANGCSRVIPGTHKSGQYVSQERLKDTIPLEAEAGDVVFWDSRLWHAAGKNETGHSRWALIGTFVRWWIKQHFNVTDALPRKIYDKLSNKEKAVLGFCSIPWLTEEEGIDMKRDYHAAGEPRSPLAV